MMNKNLKVYWTACSVVAVLCSCSRDAVIEDVSDNLDREARTITLNANLGVDSRIAFQENETNLELLWEENDVFSVMVGKAVQTPSTFTLTDGAGTSNGLFTGNIGCSEGDTLYSVWPLMTEGMSGEHACHWSLAGQKGVLDDQYVFMVGSGVYDEEGTTSMTFIPMTAAVRMKLQFLESVEKIMQVDIQVNGVYERALVNIDTGGLIFDGGTDGGVTIDSEFLVNGNELSVVAYFFAWEWSSLNDAKVVVTAADGKQYEGTMVSGRIRPGNLYDTTVELESNSSGTSEGFVEEADGSFVIYTLEGWKTFAAMIEEGNTFEGKIIKLGADIDFENELQEPIGVQEQLDMNAITFAGTLDGQNHCIKNLKIDNSVGRFTGLFAYVQKATFKNLRIASGEVKGTGNMYVGAFLGYGRGVTLINCHNEGCKVVHVYEKNSGYSGGLTGCLHRTSDGSKYSFIIACTNAAEVSGAYCPSGITGGAWSGYINVVACVNTGKISYSGASDLNSWGAFAAGISGAMGGYDSNWMYGCFTDCEIVAGNNHAGLIGDAGSSHPNLHYSYSANTSLPLLGQIWGTANRTIGYSSYNDAVDNLNKGIQMYNWKAAVPCTYKFVKGDKPTLVYAEPSTNPGGGNNNFGGGGKF